MSNTYGMTIQTQVSAATTSATLPIITVSPAMSIPQTSLTQGTLIGQTDGAVVTSVTATTGGVSIVLSDGSLKDRLGASITAVKVVSLAFYNSDATNTVHVGGNFITSSLGASTSLPLPPGGSFTLNIPTLAGLTVTGSSADTITFTAGASTAIVQVAIATRSV